MLVSWMTTNQCNLKCAHCYQDAEKASALELSTEEGEKMIDEIARAGFKVMIFSGGEPLVRPDIYELVAHAASRGLRPVFGTNGTLITPEAAARLKEAGACAMGISVDSLVPGKHDEFRGLPNAYDLTMAGIEACRRAGLPFQLHTTVVDWNRDEVCDITDFAVEIGAIAHYVFFLIPVGRGRFIQETSLEVLENEKLLADLMRKAAQVPIDVKPTCAPQFTRVAKQLGDALLARVPGGPHVLRRRQRGHRAPVRVHDRGGRRRARAALRRDLEDEPCVREAAHAGLLRLVRHVRLSRRLRRLPCPRRLLPRWRHSCPGRLLRPRQRVGGRPLTWKVPAAPPKKRLALLGPIAVLAGVGRRAFGAPFRRRGPGSRGCERVDKPGSVVGRPFISSACRQAPPARNPNARRAAA